MCSKIEMGGITPENPEQTIRDLQRSFQDWLNENPELAKKVKAELISIAGYDETELAEDGWVIIKAPIDQLPTFSTFCGSKNNKAFDKKVLDFLRNKKVEFIVALTAKKELKISSGVIEINEKDGKTLAQLISKNGGSFRNDKSRINGWSTFESE